MQQKRYYVRQVGQWYSVRAASTANVTLSGLDAGQALDGVTLAEGDTVLLKNQTTGTQNGVYTINADTVAPTRHADWAVGADSAGRVVKVREGTVNANDAFLQYAEPGVIDTDALVFIDHPVSPS